MIKNKDFIEKNYIPIQPNIFEKSIMRLNLWEHDGSDWFNVINEIEKVWNERSITTFNIYLNKKKNITRISKAIAHILYGIQENEKTTFTKKIETFLKKNQKLLLEINKGILDIIWKFNVKDIRKQGSFVFTIQTIIKTNKGKEKIIEKSNIKNSQIFVFSSEEDRNKEIDDWLKS